MTHGKKKTLNIDAFKSCNSSGSSTPAGDSNEKKKNKRCVHKKQRGKDFEQKASAAGRVGKAVYDQLTDALDQAAGARIALQDKARELSGIDDHVCPDSSCTMFEPCKRARVLERAEKQRVERDKIRAMVSRLDIRLTRTADYTWCCLALLLLTVLYGGLMCFFSENPLSFTFHKWFTLAIPYEFIGLYALYLRLFTEKYFGDRYKFKCFVDHEHGDRRANKQALGEMKHEAIYAIIKFSSGSMIGHKRNLNVSMELLAQLVADFNLTDDAKTVFERLNYAAPRDHSVNIDRYLMLQQQYYRTDTIAVAFALWKQLRHEADDLDFLGTPAI